MRKSTPVIITFDMRFIIISVVCVNEHLHPSCLWFVSSSGHRVSQDWVQKQIWVSFLKILLPRSKSVLSHPADAKPHHTTPLYFFSSVVNQFCKYKKKKKIPILIHWLMSSCCYPLIQGHKSILSFKRLHLTCWFGRIVIFALACLARVSAEGMPHQREGISKEKEKVLVHKKT